MKGSLLLDSPSQYTLDSHPYDKLVSVEKEERPRRMSKRPLGKGVSELKLLFDTYFKPVQQPTLTRHRSVGRPLIEERGSLRGTEDIRNQQLQEVLETLNKAIKKRERRKRKLIREAMRL